MNKRFLLFSLLAACIAIIAAIFLRPTGVVSSSPSAVISKETPILLVHGFNQNSDFWDDIHLPESLAEMDYLMMADIHPSEASHTDIQIKRLVEISSGQSACYKLTLPNNGTSDIRDSAILLEKAISHITQRHGCDRVRLISFSAGGIVCRQYLTKHLSSHQVESLITVSAPHLGSEHAWLADGYHNVNSLLATMQSDHSGNIVTRNSRRASAYIIQKFTHQIEKWGSDAGIDIDSKAARMLVTPEHGNYLDSLSRAPHPSDIRYHCIITEENILNYDWDKLKGDFKHLRKGDFSQMDLSTDLLDLARNAIGKAGKISKITSFNQGLTLLKFKGDGVVSKFSQNLNNTAHFKDNEQLEASLTQLETSHGGSEIKAAIIEALRAAQ